MAAIKNIFGIVFRLIRREGARALHRTRRRRGRSRLAILGGCLALACCVCSLPFALLLPDVTPTPFSRDGGSERDLAGATEAARPLTPTLPPESQMSATPQPSPTAPPSATPQPSPTAGPSETLTPTEAPTKKAVPATPTAEPTQQPAPAAAPIQPTEQSGPTVAAAVAESPVVIVGIDKREEYVDLQNVSLGPVDLSGWHLLSERGNQDCPLNGVLAAGQQLRVWAMAQDADKGGFNCGHGSNIWNNGELDRAILYDGKGVVMSTWP